MNKGEKFIHRTQLNIFDNQSHFELLVNDMKELMKKINVLNNQEENDNGLFILLINTNYYTSVEYSLGYFCNLLWDYGSSDFNTTSYSYLYNGNDNKYKNFKNSNDYYKSCAFLFDFGNNNIWIWSFEKWAGANWYGTRGLWTNKQHPLLNEQNNISAMFYFDENDVNSTQQPNNSSEPAGLRSVVQPYKNCFYGIEENDTGPLMGYNIILTEHGATMTTPKLTQTGSGTHKLDHQYFWFLANSTDGLQNGDGVILYYPTIVTIADNLSDIDSVAIRSGLIYTDMSNTAYPVYPKEARSSYQVLSIVPLLDKNTGYYFPHLYKKVFGSPQDTGFIEIKLFNENNNVLRVFGGEHLCLESSMEASF